MIKLLAITLLIVVIIGGGVYYFSNQNKPTPIDSGSTKVVNKTTPTSTDTTSNESIDSDLTAIDRDLAELQASDTVLTNDLNGL